MQVMPGAFLSLLSNEQWASETSTPLHAQPWFELTQRDAVGMSGIAGFSDILNVKSDHAFM